MIYTDAVTAPHVRWARRLTLLGRRLRLKPPPRPEPPLCGIIADGLMEWRLPHNHVCFAEGSAGAYGLVARGVSEREPPEAARVRHEARVCRLHPVCSAAPCARRASSELLRRPYQTLSRGGAVFRHARSYREDDGLALESDADEQLLIHIPFTQVVKLHTLCLKAVDGDR